MPEGYFDFVAGTGLSAANLEDYCESQSIMRFASAAARDTALALIKTEGMFAYLKDVNTLTVYTGTGTTWSTIGPVHGALPTWVPVVTQGATPTLTNTRSVYGRAGRAVSGEALVTITGAGTGTNQIFISMPVAMAATSGNTSIGEGWIYDSSAGFFYPGILMWASSTTATFLRRVEGAAASYLGNAGMVAALATGDLVSARFRFEAASDA